MLSCGCMVMVAERCSLHRRCCQGHTVHLSKSCSITCSSKCVPGLVAAICLSWCCIMSFTVENGKCTCGSHTTHTWASLRAGGISLWLVDRITLAGSDGAHFNWNIPVNEILPYAIVSPQLISSHQLECLMMLSNASEIFELPAAYHGCTVQIS